MPGARMNSPLASLSRSTRALALTVIACSSHLQDGQLDVSQADRRAGLEDRRQARAHRPAVDFGAVGRAEILDLQRIAREAEPRVAARDRGMRHDEGALIGGAADDRAAGELADTDLEGQRQAVRIGALEAQRAARRARRPNVEDMDRPADVLEVVVAAIDEGV